MKIVDVNVLVYAINTASAHHEVARRWLESAIASDEPTGFPWTVVLGFLRVSTRPGALPRPPSVGEATRVASNWLADPGVRIIRESGEHWLHLRRLVVSVGTAGNLTMDAHLAALAISHGATMVSFDRDFGRFPWLRWQNPTDGV